MCFCQKVVLGKTVHVHVDVDEDEKTALPQCSTGGIIIIRANSISILVMLDTGYLEMLSNCTLPAFLMNAV